MNKKEKSSNKCPICGRPTYKESKYCIFHASAEEKTEEEFKKALKEYINKIKEEDGDYNFKEFIFVGSANFKKDFNITIFKNANFKEATFEGDAIFQEATFEGDADFVLITFRSIVNFIGATFNRGSMFNEATFGGDTIFHGATFKGNTSFAFDNATFEEKASFYGATFKGEVSFNQVTFKGDTSFCSTFEQLVYFSGATFEQVSYFYSAAFKGDAHFVAATFKRDAFFDNATFEEEASFYGATFKKSACFKGVTFEGEVNFKLKYLGKDLILTETKFFPGKKLFIKINKGNHKRKIVLEFAYLENVYLGIDLVNGTLIDFTDALLRGTKIKKVQLENHIIQEKQNNYYKAKEIYLLIKNNFHSIGQYKDESWAFEKEKEMERKSLSFSYYKKALTEESKIEKLPILKWIKKGNLKKWIISGFSNIVYGYGERPWNVVRAAVILIFVFAQLFSIIGIGNPEIIELNGTAIHQNSGNIVDLASRGFLKNNVIRNFPDSLYFSLITFTTLGYGDFRPLEGWGRILAGSEAFIGAFMMALFVYTFARRTGGR